MGTRGSFGKTSGLSVCLNTRAARLLSAFSHEILTKCSVESNINFIMLCTYVQTHSENAPHPVSTPSSTVDDYNFVRIISIFGAFSPTFSHLPCGIRSIAKMFRNSKVSVCKEFNRLWQHRRHSTHVKLCRWVCVSVWMRVKHHLNVHSPKYSHIYDEVPAINRRKVKMFDGICSIE